MDYKLNINGLLEQDSDDLIFNTHRLYNILESCYNVLKDKIIEDLDKIVESDLPYKKKVDFYIACYNHQLLRLRQLMLTYSEVLIITLETDRDYLLNDYNELVDSLDINRKLIIDADHFVKRGDLLNPN